MLRPIGRGAYGEVWLARNVMGVLRAVKIVERRQFDNDRPYEREFAGIQRYEPVSRSAEGLVHVLHVGRNEAEGCFYYVMELADSVEQKREQGRKMSAPPLPFPLSPFRPRPRSHLPTTPPAHCAPTSGATAAFPSAIACAWRSTWWAGWRGCMIAAWCIAM